jgi:FG-GAP repeat protein
MRNQRNRIARFLIIIAMVLLGCYAGLTAIRTVGADSTKKAAPPIPALPTRSGPAAIRHLEQTGLYNSLSAAVTAARYEIEERKVGGYQASNPKQGYRSIFTREGVEVRGTSRTGEDWRMGMKLIGYGYGERKQVVTSAGLKASGDRIEYERRAREGRTLSEWYVNRAEGLEQGFTIAQAPGKRRAGERLSLWLKLSGDLQARLLESGQAIMLNGSGAGAGLRYEKLHAFDATGRGLEARMKLAGDQVKLEVADEGAIYPVMIDPTFTQQQKLEASDGAAGDLFGRSVAISGETVVVGASNDDDAVANQGSAYVFVRSGGVWSQQQKLVASDPASEDRFGDSVAISGETIVIGARLDNGTGGGDQGSAYVFVRSGGVWSQQQKLEASDPAAADVFGQSVAISSETVVVGAPSHDSSGGGDQGSAYVFVRSAGVWSQQQELEASDGAGSDNFGFSVAISGETVVVGARSDDGAAGPGQGSAYIFVRSGGVWSQQQKIEASDAASIDQFGSSVAVSGETAVVGAPNDDGVAGLDQGSAYVFVRSGGVWSQQQKLEASDAASIDQFGFTVAISGETVVVGAPNDGGAAGFFQGSAYVFVRSGGVWSQQQKLEASDAGAGDRFGTSVAINGNTIVVGADSDDGAGGLDQGSAYVFAPANQPPDCSGAFPSIATIWPPNHQFVNVTIQGVTDPDGDPVTITIDQIKQDEPTDGTGDGHTCPDGAGIGTSTAQVRAERSAHGNGRVYTIFFTASDGNGGSCQNSVTVCVPRTNNGTCTNGGASFDSTECDTSLNWHSGDTLVTHGPSADQPPSWENYCLLGGLLHLILNDPPCLP